MKEKTVNVTVFVTAVWYTIPVNQTGGDIWMQKRVRDNIYRTVLVCVDSHGGEAMAGRLYHPVLPEGCQFRNLMEFILTMEDLLDAIQRPQSFTAKRSFGGRPGGAAPSPPEEQRQLGRTATFAVRVIFRQNASWQGSVTWLETKQEESFRSVLELLLLMNSALDGQNEKAEKPGARFSAPLSGAERIS